MASSLGDVRELLERLLGELQQGRYRSDSGLGAAPGVEEIIRAHNALLDPALLEMLGEALERADDDERWRIRELRRALLHLHLDDEVQPISRRLREQIRGTRLAVEDEEVPFLEAIRRMALEPDRRKRALLARARERAIDGWEPIFLERHARLEKRSRELGYGGYGDLLRRETGLDLAALEGQLGEFLAHTQDVYREVLAWILKNRLKIDPADSEHHDLIRAFRGEEFDDLFPAQKVVPALASLSRSLQVDLQGEGRIEIDLEDRPGKGLQPFTARIQVPERIILCAPPRGGHAFYGAFLHELGHSLHAAYTKADLGFEERALGDASVTEAFAFTLERIACEPDWLRRSLGVGQPADFVQFAVAHKLYKLRRLAARFRYEVQLVAGTPTLRSADAYRVALSEGCLSLFPRALYLYDVSPHLYSARHLQGWILEAMLHRHLVHYFERDWYRNPRAGAFLLRLWSNGRRGDAARVASQVGYPALDLAPLVEDLQKRF